MPTSFITITLGGQPLDDVSKGVILGDVEIRQQLNEHYWCAFQCRQTSDRRFPLEDCLGKDVQIKTIDQEGAENVLFDGFILEGELDYEPCGSFVATLTGVTRSYKLDLTPRHAYYRQQGLSDVAGTLASLSGLNATVNCQPRTPALTYTQSGVTDFQFLLRLADDHGCWLRPTDAGVEFYDSFQSGANLDWRAEEGLLHFKIRGRLGQPSMNGSHYVPATMASKIYEKVSDTPSLFGGSARMTAAVADASNSKLPPGYLADRARAVTLDDYEKLLKKESVRTIASKVVGSGESRNEKLKPGDTVTIGGSVDAEGTYGLTQVTHRWTPNGYKNEFSCSTWKKYTNPDPPDVHRWYGIVPGRVMANDDPEQMGRIQVQMLWQEQDQTIWARMMTPHAGADRGFYFLPEVGDEVVIAFYDGDPERPLILGCVWNGTDKPPAEDFWGGEFASNNCKRIVTKSGHRIQIIDTPGQETISIATPNHARLALFENASENGRSSLVLECDDDIIIRAGGRIHMKSAFYSREVG